VHRRRLALLAVTIWLFVSLLSLVPAVRADELAAPIGDRALVGPGEAQANRPGPIERSSVKACHVCDKDVQCPCEKHGLVPPTPTPGAEGAVHFWLFYSSKCGPCFRLREEILPAILSQYGDGQVVAHERDLEQGSYELMRALEKQHGLEYGAMPEIFIGEYVLLGNEEIEARLETLIDEYLAQGGVGLPDAVLTPTLAAEPTADASESPIHLAYFYQPGCQACDRVQLDLNYLQHRYPQLVVHDFDVTEQAALCEWLGERAEVPEEKRLTAPAVFVGDEALMGDGLHARGLEALIARHADSGAKPAWGDWESSRGEATAGIVDRFRSLGLSTVLVAGLVDGLNPCAFATLVFFISYLALTDREGREVLAAGAAFALGVFLTYLGVGVGLLRFLATLPFLAAASRWIYALTAALCLFLAAGSLCDWWQAHRGKAGEMHLKMPARLRRWVNRTIREGARARAFLPVTFVTGGVVSIIELACTGQVYLPTILFVLGVPELQAQAGLYLVLYNLMFVFPLVVVFGLVYFGTTSQQLGLLIHRHMARVKLATAGLFLLLAGWMVVTLSV